ncbi:MAG: hypothetical protein R2856_09535 [Caldilineaceae bacterium]
MRKEDGAAARRRAAGEAIYQFTQSDYDEDETWLIVQLADGGYRAVRFADLDAAGGGAGLFRAERGAGRPVSAAVDRIVSVDDAAEMTDLLAWLDDHPNHAGGHRR